MSLLPAGSKLGRFEITSVLGQGAMGVVYLAQDPEIGRPVAIKTVRPGMLGGDTVKELEARFLKEARLAGRLQHPNIVTVYDVQREGDVCFIAMEYVDGHPLTRYLVSADSLPLSAKVKIIRQVAEALGHAHERGVLHRDIKPGNILVAKDGRVKVTDFGIGKFTETTTTSELTRAGHMVGSPAYMSPEQIKGEKVDGRSDLFSLGIVLYELLTGARPFPGESITTLVYQILHTEPRDPLERRSDLPVATREVIARLLAKAPEKRPADAREFIRELGRIEKIQRESERVPRVPPPSAAPPPAQTAETEPAVPSSPALSASGTPPPVPVPPRRRGGLAVILVGLAALVAAALYYVREAKRAQPAPGPVATAAAPTAAPALPATAVPEPSLVPTEEAPVEVATPAPAPTAPPATTKPKAGPRPRPTAEVHERAPASEPTPAPPAPPAAAAAPSRPDRVDAEYRTRRAVRFTSSPEQARLYLDGKYIGIADDWDNRGGGKELELRAGTHYIRMDLPGYRPFVIEVEVSAGADKDSPSVDEEMERRDHTAYEKLPAPFDRTTGAVEFQVEPSDTTVSEGSRELGLASAFGPASPLQLGGPMVHDLMLQAPGYKARLVRILVAPNAGRDRAKVKVSLKR